MLVTVWIKKHKNNEYADVLIDVQITIIRSKNTHKEGKHSKHKPTNENLIFLGETSSSVMESYTYVM